MWAFCRYTHGAVLNVHTDAFWICTPGREIERGDELGIALVTVSQRPFRRVVLGT